MTYYGPHKRHGNERPHHNFCICFRDFSPFWNVNVTEGQIPTQVIVPTPAQTSKPSDPLEELQTNLGVLFPAEFPLFRV